MRKSAEDAAASSVDFLTLRLSCDLLQFDQIEGELRRFDGEAGEAVVEIKGFGGRKNPVDYHQPRRNLARGAKGAPDGIGQQSAARPPALPCAVDREPPERHGRNGFRHVSAHRAGRLGREDLPELHGKIADDPTRTVGADDIGSARRRLQIARRAPAQPFVEHKFAGIERGVVASTEINTAEDQAVYAEALAGIFVTRRP